MFASKLMSIIPRDPETNCPMKQKLETHRADLVIKNGNNIVDLARVQLLAYNIQATQS